PVAALLSRHPRALPSFPTRRSSDLIMLLEGCFDEGEWRLAEQLQLEVIIHSRHQLDSLHASGITGPLAVWLKVDTGMHRVGVPCDHADEIIEALQRHPACHLAGVMTHLDRKSVV